jgi:hypothetical protein
MIWPLLFLLALGPSAVQDPSDLAKTVLDYWNALARRDKVAAMKSVYEEDLNNFLNRPEPEFKNPELIDISALTDTSARVTVSIDRFLPNGVFTFEAKEIWLKTDTGWKVRVDPPVGVSERIEHAVKEATAAPLAPELKVSPEQLVFYAMAPRQSAVLTILNGLESPAQIVSVEMDDSRLRVAKGAETVAPGTAAQLQFEYAGTKLKEFNVPDSLTITIEQQGIVHKFKVSVIYNYMNEIQRWILLQQEGRRSKKP